MVYGSHDEHVVVLLMHIWEMPLVEDDESDKVTTSDAVISESLLMAIVPVGRAPSIEPGAEEISYESLL